MARVGVRRAVATLGSVAVLTGLTTAVTPVLAGPAVAATSCDHLTVTPAGPTRERSRIVLGLPGSRTGQRLAPAAVMVTRRGARVPILAVRPLDPRRIDVVVVLDPSAATPSARLAVQRVSSAVVAALPRQVRVGVVSAGARPRVLAPLTTRRVLVAAAARQPVYSPSHSLADGAALADELMPDASSRFQHIVLVATEADGPGDRPLTRLRDTLAGHAVGLSVVGVGSRGVLPSLGATCPPGLAVTGSTAAGTALGVRIGSQQAVLAAPDALVAPLDVLVSRDGADLRARLETDPATTAAGGADDDRLGVSSLVAAFALGLVGLAALLGLVYLPGSRSGRVRRSREEPGGEVPGRTAAVQRPARRTSSAARRPFRKRPAKVSLAARLGDVPPRRAFRRRRDPSPTAGWWPGRRRTAGPASRTAAEPAPQGDPWWPFDPPAPPSPPPEPLVDVTAALSRLRESAEPGVRAEEKGDLQSDLARAQERVERDRSARQRARGGPPWVDLRAAARDVDADDPARRSTDAP